MFQVTLEEAATRLPELVQQIETAEEIQIMRGSVQVARIVPPEPERPRARRGSHKGQILYVAPDFDEIPECFEEYTA